MTKYLLKKFILLFFSLFTICTITFFLMKMIPGDPFTQDKIIPEEIMKSLYEYYGLDKPLYVQYLKTIKGFLTFDFGHSLIFHGRDVNQIIKTGFPISFVLGMQAMMISLFFGVIFGSISSFFRGKWQDRSFSLLTSLCICIPGFLLATILQYFLAVKLHLFPIARFQSFSHSVLPSIALAAMPCAYIARLIRSNMINVMQKDYIKTAYAKGLSSFHVVLHHAVRNSILPVISYLGPTLAQIITGSFVIEKIFAIPGLGNWLISSIEARDYPIIMGICIFYSSILMIIIFLTDILYALIDPQIKQRILR